MSARSLRPPVAVARLALIFLIAMLSSIPRAQAQIEVVIDTGRFDSVDTAWGNFDPGQQNVVVCQEVEFTWEEVSEVVITEYELAVTSPDGMFVGDSITTTIHSYHDEVPGPPVAAFTYVINDPAPAFPGATAISPADIGATITSTATVMTNTPFVVCNETGTTGIHIGGHVDEDSSIYSSGDGGASFVEVPGLTMGLHIVGRVEAQSLCNPDVLFQAGSGAGSNDAFFDSNVVVYNNSDEPLIRDVVLQPRSGDPQVLDTLEVGPHSFEEFDLSEIMPDHDFGTVIFGCPEDPGKSSHEDEAMIQATIFATLPGGEEYGQIFQAEEPEAAQGAGDTTLLFTTHDPSRYRVNVGLTAVADGTTVTVTPLGADSSPLAAGHTTTFNEGGNTQINNVHNFFNLGSTPNVMVEVTVDSGAAFAYASVLDGTGQAGLGTSDPTTILTTPEGASVVRMLELGPVQGLNEFAGSAMVHNHSSRNIQVTAAFHERGNPAPVATAAFNMAANETLGWDDIVGDLFGLSNTVGTVVLTASGTGRISAVGREYAVFRDGDGAVTGTAGQAMPGLTDGDLLRSGTEYQFLGLRERSDAGGEERSHLALFNPGGADVTVTLNAFDAGGAHRGQTFQQTVRGGELIRLNRVLNAMGAGDDGQSKRLVVTVDGPIHALAYRVNSTGDPVTLLPYPATRN